MVVPQEPDFSLNNETAKAVLARTDSLVDSARNFILLNRIEVALSNLGNIGQISRRLSILGNQSKIDEQQVASSYNLIRGFIWATSSLALSGTVLGLGDAIGGFGKTIGGTQEVEAIKASLGGVTAGLSTAFDTTLVGLLATISLHFITNFLKFKESLFLDQCNDYCLGSCLGQTEAYQRRTKSVRMSDFLRGDDEEVASFFAFQDAITAVLGILILIAPQLSFSINVLKGEEGNQEGRVDAEIVTEQEFIDKRKEREELEERLSRLREQTGRYWSKKALESAGESLQVIEDAIRILIAEVEQLELDLDSLQQTLAEKRETLRKEAAKLGLSSVQSEVAELTESSREDSRNNFSIEGKNGGTQFKPQILKRNSQPRKKERIPSG